MLVGPIPAAGHATLLGPQVGSKEMLDIRGRAMIDHLVARMRAVEPDELRLVTRLRRRT